MINRVLAHTRRAMTYDVRAGSRFPVNTKTANKNLNKFILRVFFYAHRSTLKPLTGIIS